MNTRYGVAVGVALLAAFAIGTAFIGRLHAQSKAPAYVVIDISETMDPDAYIKAVSAAEPNATQSAGGRFIVRTNAAVALDGTPPNRFVIGLVQVTRYHAGECHTLEGNEVARLLGRRPSQVV